MMPNIKKYIPFFRSNILQIFIYRGTVILWLLVDIFQFVLMVYLWQAVYQNNQTLNGFTFHEMLLYFLLTNMLMVFSQVETTYMISEEIRQGRISLMLIKPISYKGRLYSEVLGRQLGIFMITAPIVILTGFVLVWLLQIQLTISIVSVLIGLLFLPLIFILIFEFSYIFGTLSIYTTNVFGLVILMSVTIQAVSGQILPLALYPSGFLKIINYLPFRYISYPVLIILGKIPMTEALNGLWVLALWGVIFFSISTLLFRLSMKKIVVFGG